MDFIHKYLLTDNCSFNSPNGFDFLRRDISFHGPGITVIPLVIILLGCFIWSLIWVYSDACKRNKNPLFAVVFILVAGWPYSLWCWHWLRPEIKLQSTNIKDA